MRNLEKCFFNTTERYNSNDVKRDASVVPERPLWFNGNYLVEQTKYRRADRHSSSNQLCRAQSGIEHPLGKTKFHNRTIAMPLNAA